MYYGDPCGYCSEGKNYQWNVWPGQLSCDDYQTLLDSGWRRSGGTLYVPDLPHSCCAEYTIKLDALKYAPNNNMREVVDQWNNYIINGYQILDEPESSSAKDPFDLVSAIHGSDRIFPTKKDLAFARNFEVALEPSVYTVEKFKLYCKYQKAVHGEDYFRPDRFKSFLVESPLLNRAIEYKPNYDRLGHLPRTYGTHHMTYRLQGELVAFSVIDVLPGCLSSVYFVYRPDLREFSIGKLSIMREAALVREMHAAGASGVKDLYLGFYVRTSPKSKYKGDFTPSSLLDLESLEWYPLRRWKRLLDRYHYASIARPEVNTPK